MESTTSTPQQSSPAELPLVSDLSQKAVYALATLSTLWALAGGEWALVWARLPTLSVLLCAFGTAGILLQKDLDKRSRTLALPNKMNLILGIGSGLATGLPFALVIFLTGRNLVPMPAFIQNCVVALKGSGFVNVLLATFILAPGWELICRGLLQKDWGLANVAFLEALTIGFGLQMLFPFLTVWAMAWFWGYMNDRYNFSTAAVSHVVWNLLIFGTLAFVG